VAELQKMLGISIPNLSQHLAVLKSAGIAVARREGKRVYCSLPIPEVKQACELIHGALRRQIKGSRSLVAQCPVLAGPTHESLECGRTPRIVFHPPQE
jgi:DNA-binding transcriptional ArsR family regulator